jgi:hypothetical protein
MSVPACILVPGYRMPTLPAHGTPGWDKMLLALVLEISPDFECNSNL